MAPDPLAALQAVLEALAAPHQKPVTPDLGEGRRAVIAKLEERMRTTFDPITRAFLHFRATARPEDSTDPGWTQWGIWSVHAVELLADVHGELVGVGAEHRKAKVVADAGVRAQWYCRGWLPIAEFEGDALCLDFDPAPGGRAGQVVRFNHDYEKRELVAPDLLVYLTEVLPRENAERRAPDGDEDDEPAPRTRLVASFFVDGDAIPVPVSVFAGEAATPLAVGTTPLEVGIELRGTYSARFEHEGRVHWRRNVLITSAETFVDFHW